MVRAARAAGVPVTAEATTHHFTLTDAAVASYDPVFKVNPPLRTVDDIEALRAALRDGTIDVVATDHAPHAAHEKEVPFEEAPAGIIGLETAAAAVNEAVGLDAATFFERMATTPARIAGLPTQGRPLTAGGTANVTVFDPASIGSSNRGERRHDLPGGAKRMVMPSRGVEYTLVNGEVIYEQGALTGAAPGQVLRS